MYLYDWTSYSRANTLIANDPNTPRCQWTIEEVVLDEDLIKTFDLSLISTLQSVEPIALTEGAEVIYPSEYTYTPAELNASIANIKAFSSDVYSEVKTMITSTDYANVSHYKGLCESYGVALSVPCTLKYRFSTLILPINYAFPSTWSVYSCSAADESDRPARGFPEEKRAQNRSLCRRVLFRRADDHGPCAALYAKDGRGAVLHRRQASGGYRHVRHERAILCLFHALSA